MKLLKSAFICACLAFSSCTMFQEPVTIQVYFANDCAQQEQEEAHQIIIERIKFLYKVKDFTMPKTGMFSVTYFPEKKTDILSNLLSEKGEIIIHESVFASMVSDILLDNFDMTSETRHPLANSILSTRAEYPIDSPVLVAANENNKAYIDSLFQSEEIQKLIPDDVILVWNEESRFENVYYELFTLKKSNFLPLNKETVKKIKPQKMRNSSDTHLHIELHPEFHQVWADFTRNSMYRCVPFVCDGKIISYPIVNAEITGGKLAIFGNFSADELLTMIGFVESSVLNCPVNLSYLVQNGK